MPKLDQNTLIPMGIVAACLGSVISVVVFLTTMYNQVQTQGVDLKEMKTENRAQNSSTNANIMAMRIDIETIKGFLKRPNN